MKTASEMAEDVLRDLHTIQGYVQVSSPDGPRGGWRDLESLLHLATIEAARVLQSENTTRAFGVSA